MFEVQYVIIMKEIHNFFAYSSKSKPKEIIYFLYHMM
jgi:hypothetical protein